MDETSASSQLEQLKNLCLDERSGEYVSKTELKRRLKIQEKRGKREARNLATVSSKPAQKYALEINEDLTPNVPFF